MSSAYAESRTIGWPTQMTAAQDRLRPPTLARTCAPYDLMNAAANVLRNWVLPPDAVLDARLPAVLYRGPGADGVARARARASQADARRGKLFLLCAVELALLPAARRQLAGDLRRWDRDWRRVSAAHPQVDRSHHGGDASAAAVHVQVSRFPGRVGQPPAACVRLS